MVTSGNLKIMSSIDMEIYFYVSINEIADLHTFGSYDAQVARATIMLAHETIRIMNICQLLGLYLKP